MAVTSDASLSAACVLRLCCSLHTRVGRLCLLDGPAASPGGITGLSLVGHHTCLENSGEGFPLLPLLPPAHVVSCRESASTRPNRAGPSHCRPSSGLSTFPQHSEDWLLLGLPGGPAARAPGLHRACTATARVQSPVGSGGPASQGVPTQSAASCSPGSLGGPHGPMRRPLGKLRLHSCVSILSSLSPLTTCVRVCVLSPSPAQLLQPVGLYLPPNLRTLSAAASLNHFLLPAALRPALALTCSPLRPLSSVTFAGSLTSSCC